VPSQPASDTAEAPSRSDRKRAAILEAAQQAFFANGYVGTTMDQVAATAAVSKQTVYKHFSDKATLFREVVTNVMRVGEAGIPADVFWQGGGSMEERLRSFCRSFLKGVMQPDVLKLRRLVIGEAGRFPELGRMFYDLGHKRATDQLTLALQQVAERNGVAMKDPEVAAEQLLSLVLSKPLDRSMLLGNEFRYTDAFLDKTADEGVAAFMGAYGLHEK
jgi:TetR/AcrR family transcriptional repressor of mexJK operon